MGWGTWLMAMVGPAAKQVMISLGFSVVTFAGVAAAVNGLLSAAKSAWAGSMGADVANLVAMSGANTGLSIIAGAIIGRVAMLTLKKFTLG